jgi:hypothetical protein
MAFMDVLMFFIGMGKVLVMEPFVWICLYSVPLAIALLSKKRNAFPIIIINVLTGWFLPAWILLFLWAIFGEKSISGTTSQISDLKFCGLCNVCQPAD